MKTFQEDVQAFHRAMGHPAPVFPIRELDEKTKEHLRNRAVWMHEEADELVEAVEADDLVGVMDALVDSTYFSVGGFVAIGHLMLPYWENVQASNMAKLGPDGKPVPHPTLPDKIGKPEGWEPPEGAHRLTLDAETSDARIEIAARLWAYASMKELDVPLDLGLSALELARCAGREAHISGKGVDEVVKLYRELVKEYPELEIG